MKLITPHGDEVIGTFERLTGRANIVPNSFKRDAKGNIDFDWQGETKIFWDDQESVMRNGEDGKRQRVYLDENGTEWLEGDLTLVEEE